MGEGGDGVGVKSEGIDEVLKEDKRGGGGEKRIVPGFFRDGEADGGGEAEGALRRPLDRLVGAEVGDEAIRRAAGGRAGGKADLDRCVGERGPWI